MRNGGVHPWDKRKEERNVRKDGERMFQRIGRKIDERGEGKRNPKGTEYSELFS